MPGFFGTVLPPRDMLRRALTGGAGRDSQKRPAAPAADAIITGTTNTGKRS